MEFRERSFSRGTDERLPKPTTRMNDETWERFKPFLCSLYKKYTLSVVMNVMEKKYGIVQSKRQYGYRFEKWGIKKYNANEKKTSHNSLSPSAINDSMDYGDVGADFDREAHSFNQHPLSDRCDPDTLMAAVGSENMEYDESLDSHKATKVVVPYPWATGSSEEANKLAADFCAAMLDDTNAFALYSNLYEILSNSSQSVPETREFLAICCARVAGKPDNARSARAILAREWTETPTTRVSDSPFVLSMLKAYVGSHQEDSDKSAFVKQISRNVEQLVGSDGSLGEVSRKYSSIDLVAYFFLDYALEIYDDCFDDSNPPNFMTEHLLNEFITTQPFMNALRNDCPSPLSLCLRWCKEQLRLNHPVALQDAPVQPSTDMRCWWYNIRVFCTLWGVMTHLVRANCAPVWYTQCESAFGIPPSELLITLSWMIRAEATATETDSIISDTELLIQAADGADKLLQVDESQLWIDFLERFTWMNELANPGDAERSFEATVQDELRKYVSKMLRVELPHPAGTQSTSVGEVDFYSYPQHGFPDFDINSQMDYYS
ncbi:hypothetical protein FOQG_04371 [Fusarium oxysporum f. sp. raphani 54005]|uniref:Clr5 domain-containing protein n=11 Tax=Fusarium oxysporum TaxID=5507 RepID=X0CSE0_FUSOX|nr:hypothetical protein FOXG_06314 [Fusarium oxysporum f. sp. lycopersici 4287]EXA47466.1 hypothetical protein FOVG_04566 [Fusarium oxysporum f. sp. pisi HDV247]EXK35398.1 hypothetical protein FOMG_10537 [Fusarium oxysporum f. sp. melonis 26406]EXK94218.1 hypothetical protein FOQG_04371 [Fusarium oxysporum f. sp. raphani 54005]KAJ9423511.1 hypothetical protein QL093DRAFT_2270377 [Fusarium oxysporum]KNB04050.1 hypothetical protein FOXG_06314 [Fusarium oxysporum f. sp. lycopersici 4287]